LGGRAAKALDRDSSHTGGGTQGWQGGWAFAWCGLPKRAPELNPLESSREMAKAVSANRQYAPTDEHANVFLDRLRGLTNVVALQAVGLLSERFRLHHIASNQFCPFT
jgi:hypothetical protein